MLAPIPLSAESKKYYLHKLLLVAVGSNKTRGCLPGSCPVVRSAEVIHHLFHGVQACFNLQTDY
jgi:hypothetical protein